MVAINFISGGNRSTPGKPNTCRKSLKTLSHKVVSSTHSLERDSNEHLLRYNITISNKINLKTNSRSIVAIHFSRLYYENDAS